MGSKRPKSKLTAQDSWQLGGHIWSGDPGNKLLSSATPPSRGQSRGPHFCTCSPPFWLPFFLDFVAADKGQRMKLHKEIPREEALRKVLESAYSALSFGY